MGDYSDTMDRQRGRASAHRCEHCEPPGDCSRGLTLAVWQLLHEEGHHSAYADIERLVCAQDSSRWPRPLTQYNVGPIVAKLVELARAEALTPTLF